MATMHLQKFAPEIRQLIFQFWIAAWIPNKSPAILVALRSDPELYYEALEGFYKMSSFPITLCTLFNVKIKRISYKIVERIRNLFIKYVLAHSQTMR
jgi:hypothetical protein